MIPIFDSLYHPQKSSVSKEMTAAGIEWACAIGMVSAPNYSHESFIKTCKADKRLVPIAAVSPAQSSAGLVREIKLVKQLGFRGIKVHPRTMGIDWTQKNLPLLLKTAGEQSLVVMLCTYAHGTLAEYPETDPLYSLVKLLKKAPKTKVILVHGGDVRVLQYAELARANPNLLLDLSFTMLKYAGSSLDLDLRYLFEKFDRRICIGTDYPDFTFKELRMRFEQLSKRLEAEKKRNIAHVNLTKFFGIG